MLKSVRIYTALVLFLSVSYCAAQQNPVTDKASEHGQVVSTYCLGCHNDAMKTAGLSLEQASLSNPGESLVIWEKVLRKLRSRTMPPSGMPRPDDATYNAFADYLQTSLDQYALANPYSGKSTLRRLNRTEYVNAVRDMLAVEINNPADLLPADDTMYGFDNIGEVLTLSPLLTEQYIGAARKIRRQAISDKEMQPVFDFYTLSGYLMQEERVSEELPFGSRGGIAIHHNFPLDGEYEIQVELQKNSREYIRGLTEPHQLDIRVDGERVKQFAIGGEVHGKSAAIFSSGTSGDVEQEHYERTADKALNVRFPARAGNRLVTVAFMKETTVPEEPLYPAHTLYDYAQYKGGEPAVRTVAIGGPYNAKGSTTTASHDRIFVCKPASINDTDCARRILSTLAHRAYRRPVTDQDMDDLMVFFKQGQQEGDFETGIGMAIERVLAGPEFLFRVETTPASVAAGEIHRITDLDLATRLSFFLWSSIPDEELLAVAEAGKLGKPDELKKQVSRMLADPRSKALVDNFASQWLNLGNLNAALPDGTLFPYFDENLRLAFGQETLLFVEYILREDRPLLELLNADYTFLNDRLARHYDIPEVYGSHFRKVKLKDGTRGGILGQGSLLTVTSYANRTAPTIRGKWILENILGAPPPPPPANIPGLKDKNAQGKILSMRGRMEQHRANPVCASCHKVMDPLGFALENYDAIGKWRTVDAASGSAIDNSGALPDGTTFAGMAELREVLLQKRRDDFVLTAAEKLLTYAIGRGVTYADAPVVRELLHKTAPEEYRLSSLIMAIIESSPFQTRRATGHDDI